MLARFLHNTKVRYSYENHRSKTYQETTCELEYIEHFDSRPFMQKRSRISLTKLIPALKEDIAERLAASTQGQPLGQTVSRTGYRMVCETN